MQELTEKRALEICRDLWDHLADNPEMEKYEWPGWNEVGDMQSDCPCCEYADSNCTECPLLYYWPEKGDALPCLRPTSPFSRWGGAELSYSRTMFAKRIANYARKALKELDKE